MNKLEVDLAEIKVELRAINARLGIIDKVTSGTQAIIIIAAAIAIVWFLLDVILTLGHS